MAEISKENMDFILKHAIPLGEVFDATGWKSKDYKEFMKENGYLVAYGVTRCSNGGHELRTRYGHCVICDPAKIAYVKRKNLSGYVYIAISLENKLLKVGCAKDYKKRIFSLNSQHYGEINDWQLVAYSYQDKMGEVEHKIQLQFSDYQVKRPFNKDNKSVEASEIFDINLQTLLNKIDELGYEFEFPNQTLIQLLSSSNTKSKRPKKQIYQIPIGTVQTNPTKNQLSHKEKVTIEAQRATIDELIEEGRRKVEEKARADAIEQEQRRLEEIERERLRCRKIDEDQKRAEAERISVEQQEIIKCTKMEWEYIESRNIYTAKNSVEEYNRSSQINPINTINKSKIESHKTRDTIVWVVCIAILISVLILIFTNK